MVLGSGGAAAIIGFWWGRHVFDVDPSNTPTSVWVSLALAVALAGTALLWRRHLEEAQVSPTWYSRYYAPEKLWWMALFNLVLAGAIVWGFQTGTPPHILK